MENNFNFLIFSFFEIDSLTAMKEAVREVFIQDFKKGKANFQDSFYYIRIHRPFLWRKT